MALEVVAQNFNILLTPMAKDNFRQPKKVSEFDQKVIDVARVTRVMAGGKRMRFRATVAIGDHKGRVGWAFGKAADVSEAVNKAVNKAQKHMIKVQMVNQTIPHQVEYKLNAARVLLKPAKPGTGIIAGGSARVILDLSGIPNIYAKLIGRTTNKMANLAVTFEALKKLKTPKVRAPKKEVKKEVVGDNQ